LQRYTEVFVMTTFRVGAANAADGLTGDGAVKKGAAAAGGGGGGALHVESS
jgi:hypothetical protein